MRHLNEKYISLAFSFAKKRHDFDAIVFAKQLARLMLHVASNYATCPRKEGCLERVKTFELCSLHRRPYKQIVQLEFHYVQTLEQQQ